MRRRKQEKTARKAWDAVKGWAGGAEKTGEAGTEEKQDASVPDPKDEQGKPLPDDTSLDAEAAESSTDSTDRLSWRDVSVNILNPGSPEQKSLKGIFSAIAVAGGLLGLVLAMTGWIRREDQRICICAAVAGVLAMAWVYVMGAIAIAIVAVILGPLISS